MGRNGALTRANTAYPLPSHLIYLASLCVSGVTSKMANLRQVPLTCSGHTRPVVHLDFSDITDCGYFLISACKGMLPSKIHTNHLHKAASATLLRIICNIYIAFFVRRLQSYIYSMVVASRTRLAPTKCERINCNFIVYKHSRLHALT